MNEIKGRRIHIAGSASKKIDLDELIYAHKIVDAFSKKILQSGGGLIVTLGEEPKHKEDSSISTIFDWTILEALKTCLDEEKIGWPKAQGAPVIAVGFGDALNRIPPDRFKLFQELQESGCLDIYFLNNKLNIGGLLREKQEVYGDILLTMGGGPGVNHLCQLYMNSKKHVISLDLQIKDENNASIELFQDALQNPEQYFDYTPKSNSASAFSGLSIKNRPDIEEAWRRLEKFILNLKKPRVFYVRLLNKNHCCYPLVEEYFREIVDPIIKEMGYERYEAGKEELTEGFMNVEIFKSLHYSSLVIVDLTGLRANCMIELGYALGMGKKTIIIANENTDLPWDVDSIQCHLWKYDLNNDIRKKELKEFLRLNINKGPLIKKVI